MSKYFRTSAPIEAGRGNFPVTLLGNNDRPTDNQAKETYHHPSINYNRHKKISLSYIYSKKWRFVELNVFFCMFSELFARKGGQTAQTNTGIRRLAKFRILVCLDFQPDDECV